MSKVHVDNYTRRTNKGKIVSVSQYNRNGRKLSNYEIEKLRQHKHATTELGYKIDQSVTALLPGKRTSKKGNVYYERRFNRSDQYGNGI